MVGILGNCYFITDKLAIEWLKGVIFVYKIRSLSIKNDIK